MSPLCSPSPSPEHQRSSVQLLTREGKAGAAQYAVRSLRDGPQRIVTHPCEPAWSGGPSSCMLDSPLCQWEHWEKVPRVCLYYWRPCVNPYSAKQNQAITYTCLSPPQTLSQMDVQLPILLLCKQTKTASWPDSLLRLPVFLYGE